MSGETRAHKVGVFWNMDDCQIPDGEDIHEIKENIKSGYESNGYQGKILIKAYSDKKEMVDILFADFVRAGMILQNRVFGETQKLDQMLVDILLFGIDNPAPAHVSVISKEIPEGTELFYLLEDLKASNYSISVVLPKEIKSEKLCEMVSFVTTWPREDTE